MKVDDNTITFEGVVYEDVIADIREVMQNSAPDGLTFDFSMCDDLHLAVLQVLMAYKKLYTCSYDFGDKEKLYKMTLEGFNISENCCS